MEFGLVEWAGLIITVMTVTVVGLQLRTHPKGLVILFFAEMWERFSYYGMRGLLTFFMTQHFLMQDAEASSQYGSYTSLVYLLPVVGGLLADRDPGIVLERDRCLRPLNGADTLAGVDRIARPKIAPIAVALGGNFADRRLDGAGRGACRASRCW